MNGRKARYDYETARPQGARAFKRKIGWALIAAVNFGDRTKRKLEVPSFRASWRDRNDKQTADAIGDRGADDIRNSSATLAPPRLGHADHCCYRVSGPPGMGIFWKACSGSTAIMERGGVLPLYIRRFAKEPINRFARYSAAGRVGCLLLPRPRSGAKFQTEPH